MAHIHDDGAMLPLDAIVAEEDTYLVLSAEATGTEEDTEPEQLLKGATSFTPIPVGTVEVRSGSPLRFLAIVHDLDRDPTCTEEWIARALEAVFREAEQHGVRTLGLPLLGTRHGTVSAERVMQVLNGVLAATSFHHVEEIWLLDSSGRTATRVGPGTNEY